MKRFEPVLSLVVFATVFYFVTSESSVGTRRHQHGIESERGEKRDLPEYDFFHAQRVFPKMKLPEQVSAKMQRSMAAFRGKNADRSPNASVAWTLAGPSNIGGRVTAIAIDPTDPAGSVMVRDALVQEMSQ